MSTKHRGITDKPYQLPPNPSWLVFERSDGDESLWPSESKTRRDVDAEGHVNYFHPVEPDDASDMRWRHGVGQAVARQLELPEGQNYVLKSFPQGYKMYDHHKGPHEEPRRDLYLYGSKSGRFRSVNEFVPHAFWLLRDQTNNPVCECKYCSKRPQREISFTMGLSQGSGSTPGRSPGPARIKSGGLPSKNYGRNTGKPRERRLRDQIHKPYAAVHRIPKPAKERSGPKQKMLRERNNDLRAILSDTGKKGRRWFREGELLWCELDSPILGKNGIEDGIAFWPGLVEEVVLKINPIPLTTATLGSDIEMQDGVPNHDESSSRSTKESSEGKSSAYTNALTWDVHQFFVYKIKFLALEYSTMVPAERLLPYQAYSMSSALFNVIQEFPLDEVDISPEAVSAFDLQSTPNNLNHGYKRFEEAVAPYTLAIQIASAVAGYWCPTDEWEFKFSVAPTNPPTNGRPGPGPSSLSNVIVSASQYDAALVTDTGSISSGPSGMVSSLDDPTLRLLGQAPPPRPYAQIVTQMRFQGLWWGGERIWTDDIVRLKMSRHQLAPNGAADIYSPSGPSRQTVEYHLASDHPPENLNATDFGAGGRGVFMRLEGLFVVDIPREDGVGTRKECRACGMLYELADEEWEDPNAPQAEDAKGDATSSSQQTAVDKHGTGATRPLESSNGTWSPSQVGSSLIPPLPFASGPAIAGQTESETSLPNVQLSHPILSVPTKLPVPPKGFKFRPILSPGCEAVISLSLVAGRYYPLLLSHPLLQASVEKAILNMQEEGGLQDENHLWSLEGLSPGFFNSVDPVKMKTSRAAMLRDAHLAARNVMEVAREQIILLKKEKLTMEEHEGPAKNEIEEFESFGGMDVDVDN